MNEFRICPEAEEEEPELPICLFLTQGFSSRFCAIDTEFLQSLGDGKKFRVDGIKSGVAAEEGVGKRILRGIASPKF